jgi:hypothetical protein
MLKFSANYASDLSRLKAEAWEEKMNRKDFVLQWTLDTSRFDMIPFKGYRSKTKPSVVTGHPRQYYDREDPWESEIPYYRYFKEVRSAPAPAFYILPSAWSEVVDRLKINGVKMDPLSRDTLMEVQVYYIEDFETVNQPYNGHYRHSNVSVRTEMQKVHLYTGDFMIPLDQPAREYLVQTLEPNGYDSFFSWNFFDEVLFRNEYFSPYIFEETAEQLLEENAELREAFLHRQKEDQQFADNPYLQLRYIYERSPWSEKSYRRYPVYRINQ